MNNFQHILADGAASLRETVELLLSFKNGELWRANLDTDDPYQHTLLELARRHRRRLIAQDEAARMQREAEAARKNRRVKLRVPAEHREAAFKVLGVAREWAYGSPEHGEDPNQAAWFYWSVRHDELEGILEELQARDVPKDAIATKEEGAYS